MASTVMRGSRARVRVLKHHLEPAAGTFESLASGMCVISSPWEDVPTSRLDQTHDGAARRGLAASRFAHESECLAGADCKRHAIDSTYVSHMSLEDQALSDQGNGPRARITSRMAAAPDFRVFSAANGTLRPGGSGDLASGPPVPSEFARCPRPSNG